MSKLDTILKQFRGWSPMSDGQFDELSNKMSAEVKDLMLELVQHTSKNTFRVDGRVNGNDLITEGYSKAVREIKEAIESL